MSRTQFLRRLAPALTLVAVLAACGTSADDQVVSPPDDATEESAEDPAEDDTAEDGSGDDEEAGADEPATFPVTVTHDGGELTISERPEAIVSLSPTGTEILFGIGAGDQVVAVDSFSYFPEEAPVTDLSGFDPNVEAILAYEPDLVIASDDRNDLVAGLEAVDVPVLLYGSANDLETAFAQFEALGTATGNDATGVVEQIEADLAEIQSSVEVEPGLTYYHELSPDLFSATSATFIGEIYGLWDMVNIADEADQDGSGFPQLSAEYVVDSDPAYVFLADVACCEVTAESFGGRDGYGGITAVVEDDVVELPEDIPSRWGPRMVEFAQIVADALAG